VGKLVNLNEHRQIVQLLKLYMNLLHPY